MTPKIEKTPEVTSIYLDMIPPIIVDALCEDKDFCDEEDVYKQYAVQFDDFPAISWKSLFAGLRRFFQTKETQTLTLKTGVLKIKQDEHNNTIIACEIDGEERQVAPPYLDLLSPDTDIRLKTLQKCISAEGVTAPDFEVWKAKFGAPPSDKIMHEFLREIESAFPPMMDKIGMRLQSGGPTPEKVLLPDTKLSYFLCYGPEPSKNETWEDYLLQKLIPYFKKMVERDWESAFSIIIPLGLCESLTIKHFLQEISNDDLHNFISAKPISQNPISRIGLIDLCFSRAENDERFIKIAEDYITAFFSEDVIGKDFEAFKLFKNLEAYIFSRLRMNPRFSDYPLFWLKLISWGHSGHLMELLSNYDIQKDIWEDWLHGHRFLEDTINEAYNIGQYPLWADSLDDEKTHKGFVYGYFTELATKYSDVLIKRLGLSEKLGAKLNEIASKGILLECFLPCPLLDLPAPCEDRVPQERLKEKELLFKDIEKLLSEEPKRGLGLAAHISKFIKISEEIINLVIKHVESLDFPADKEGRLHFWDHLYFASFLSVTTSSTELMGKILEKLSAIATQGSGLENDTRMLLVCAIISSAANQDYNKRVEALSGFLCFCCWRVPKGETAQILYDVIRALEKTLPLENWHYSKALAIAKMASTAR